MSPNWRNGSYDPPYTCDGCGWHPPQYREDGDWCLADEGYERFRLHDELCNACHERMTAPERLDRADARAAGYVGDAAGVAAAAAAWRAGEPERQRIQAEQARQSAAELKIMFARQDMANARARGREDARAGRRCNPRQIKGREAKALREAYSAAYAKALARKAG
jgi:hypothetical protein